MQGYMFENVASPIWLQKLWDEIDNKSFGDSLNIFTDDVEMLFGTGHWHGREAIREALREFDAGLDTKHETCEFWDGGPVKIVHGKVMMTSHENGKTVKPIMTHFFYMSEHTPAQIGRWVGAVGPTKFPDRKSQA